MSELKIRNNEDFELYFKSVNSNEILTELISNQELIETIIDNNLLWQNIDLIIKKVGNYKLEFFKLLFRNKNSIKLLNEEIYTIFDYEFDKNFYSTFFNFLIENNIIEKDKLYNLIENTILNKCKYINYELIDYLYNMEFKYIVINNFEKIIIKSYNLFELRKIVKNNQVLLNKINKYIDNNPDNLIYEMIINGFESSLEQIKEEKIFYTIKFIIDEIRDYEQVNYSDIEYISNGAYSFVYSIGSKVIKIGKDRERFVIDNNKRFLKPILRTKIPNIENNGILGIIEVTEKVNTDNITEEIAYKIYKELRDLGYIWADCRPKNIGRLIRKNKIYFNDLNPFKEAINYKTDISKELNANNYVILDNDYIYKEEEFENLDIKIKQMYLESISQYEERYIYEKSKKNNK